MRMQRKPTKRPSAFRRPSQKSLLIWGLLLSVSLLSGQWTPNVFAQSAALSDTRISQAVTDALVQDPGVNAALVDVETSDGIVTVSGSVNNILAKERATHVAEAVKGARAVVNTIDVAAPLRSDREIQQDIEDAWLRDPATESYELSVTVNSGVATLTGTVDSWQEKQLSARVAKGVRGVKGILNNIDVSYDEERTDYEIKSEIRNRSRYLMD